MAYCPPNLLPWQTGKLPRRPNGWSMRSTLCELPPSLDTPSSPEPPSMDLIIARNEPSFSLLLLEVPSTLFKAEHNDSLNTSLALDPTS